MRLDADALIDEARTEAGADDLDDDGLPARLADLLGQLDERLDDAGRLRAAAVVRGLLVARLRFFDCRRRLPIAQEEIDQPIIVMGEGRSGTTLLQVLLGRDVDSRLLEFWEVMRLSPPPAVADVAERRRRLDAPSGSDEWYPDDTYERRRRGDADWREILEQIPRWLVSHPYNAMHGANPPEDERLWAFDFRSLPPTAWWRVPTVQHPPFRLVRDDARQYEIHRMVLQHLQHGAPPRRWVLKGVTHQHRLPALLAAYPDAVFVWIHRDPLVALASRVELQAQVYEGIGALDRSGFTAATVERGVADFTAAAEDPLAADPRIRHLQYRDVVAEPMDAIAEVYASAGLEVHRAYEKAVDAWLSDNVPNRFGRFEYSVDDLGVDVDELDRRLDPYRDRFGVPREPVPRGGRHGLR